RLGLALVWGYHFFPWGFVHFAAAPIAILRIWESFVDEDDRAAKDANTPALLLSACYLAWLAQAIGVQLTHEYVLAASVPPAIAVTLTSDRFARPAWAMRGLLVAFFAMAVVAHPLLKPAALRVWPLCFSEGSSPRVRDMLSTNAPRHTAGMAHWQDLDRVEQFLRSQNAGDYEIVSWDDNSQYLYTQLSASPGSRFMHNVLWLNFFASRRMEVMKEAFKPAVRFIVTDTQMAGYPSEAAAVDAHRDEARLPDEVHPELRTMFPWNQRVVFRAGRYMVHEVDHTTTPRLPSP
ncbi:MAG: hypothetical protein KDA41_14795, partial [Planctomycetales bacterium]|nr:hypothetical protein [Planctomycetales bacterium]